MNVSRYLIMSYLLVILDLMILSISLTGARDSAVCANCDGYSEQMNSKWIKNTIIHSDFTGYPLISMTRQLTEVRAIFILTSFLIIYSG